MLKSNLKVQLKDEYNNKKFAELCYQISCWLAVFLVFFIPLSTTAVTILSTLYIILVLLSKKYKEIFIFLKSPITLSIFFYITINILGTFYTTAEISDIYLILKKTIRLALLPFLMPAFMQEKWQKRGIAAFIISVIILAFYNYFLMTYNLSLPPIKDRIYSSSFIAFGIFLLLFFSSQVFQNLWLKFLSYLFTAFLIYFLIFLNDSFTGQIIFFILMILLINKQKKMAPASIVALLVGLLAVFSAINPNVLRHSSENLSIPIYSRCIETFRNLKDYVKKVRKTKKLPEANGAIVRVEFYARTLRLCFKKPFIGYGTGSFSTVYNAYYPTSSDRMPLRNPHNQYLLTFFELGLSGFLAFCFVLYMVTRYIKTISSKKSNLEQLAIEGIFYFMLVGCAINSWLLDFTSAYFFISMLAIFYARPTYFNASYHACWKLNDKFNNVAHRVHHS